MVADLVKCGQVELLIEAARERGDWFCADAAVRELLAAGEADRALAVMEPFAATGWHRALDRVAEIMILQGRVEEALALVRPPGRTGSRAMPAGTSPNCW